MIYFYYLNNIFDLLTLPKTSKKKIFNFIFFDKLSILRL